MGSMLGWRWVMCLVEEIGSSCMCLVAMGRYVVWCNILDFIFIWVFTLYVVVGCCLFWSFVMLPWVLWFIYVR